MLVSTLLLMAILGEPAPATGRICSPELFRLGRSKNANVVVYEASVSAAGTLDPVAPVKASWILLADKGEREELSWLEWRMAYGFEVRPDNPGSGFVFTFKAKEDRPVRIGLRDGCPVAVAAIGARQGILRRIFIKSDDRLIPSVEYVDVFGSDLETGEDLHERIVVSTPQPPQPDYLP